MNIDILDKVKTLGEALEWFLNNARGEVLCIKDDVEMKVCKSYIEAQELYK